MQASIESEVASLLDDLLAGQDELLLILGRKRKMLAEVDHQGLADVAAEEQRLAGTLQNCLTRREQLLRRAADEGLPSDSIEALTTALAPPHRDRLARHLASTGSRARLLQHQSFVNWVVIQRTLIHLSQLLEIIATGGRLRPTYGDRESSRARAALVDQEA